MKISPSKKRDYKEILENSITYIEKSGFDFSMDELNAFISINCDYNKLDSTDNTDMVKILDCAIGLLIKQYKDIIKEYNNCENKYNHKIINFYKVIIYDFIDLRNAICTFIGIQLQGVVRSIIEHTRMYLLCIFDDDFQIYYFSDYTEEEKKKRYYKKRGKKIDDKLKDIYVNANKTESIESLLEAINTDDLYIKIYDDFSQLSHLSEFTIVNEILDDSLDLSFKLDNTWKYEKYYDRIIEYIIITIIIILKRNDEKINHEDDRNKDAIFKLLSKIYYELFRFRYEDYILIQLKSKLKQIYEE